ncbi:MAG: hypothetical protein KJ607_03650 [Bacteroidetes bacterium]|nr:hypothetical protein [Bacteroidota bacterium]
MLIELVLVHLDMYETDLLFSLYSRDMIESVWRKAILSQLPRYKNLNKLIGWYYFDKNIN